MREWALTRRRDVLNNGWSGVKRSVHDVYAKLLGDTMNGLGLGDGVPVYELDWDVLVILDACRADLMAEVATADGDTYPFLADRTTTRSLGSNSKAWLRANFGEKWAAERADTAMVTGNPYTADLLDPNDFGLLDEVWRYAWDDENQTVPARPITDRAIATARGTAHGRLIVHYMQPHAPFMPNPTLNPGPDERDIWRAVMRGRVDRDEVWSAYRDNLRYVLGDVAVLLENLDADTVVISADHGNAIGEWGVYGHPSVPIDVLREVPLVRTKATDRSTHDPAEYDATVSTSEADVQNRLADLGYIEQHRGE